MRRKNVAVKVEVTKQCEAAGCGASFTAKRNWQRFCSVACRWKEWSRWHPRVGTDRREE